MSFQISHFCIDFQQVLDQTKITHAWIITRFLTMQDMGSISREARVCSSGVITFITTKAAVLASPSQRRSPFKTTVFAETTVQESISKLAAVLMSAATVSMETESTEFLCLGKA